MKYNLFNEIPAALPEELITVLAASPEMRIERMVSDGQASPEGFWYDQDQNEWVLLVSGSAVLSVETAEGTDRVEMGPGDHLLLAAHQRHRVESTSPDQKTIWLAVFY